MIGVYLSILGIVLMTLWVVSFFIPIQQNKGLLGSAKFTKRALRKNPDELMVAFPYGVNRKTNSRKNGVVHSACIGPSGSGKSQKVLIMSTLCSFDRSMVVLDIKGEISKYLVPLAEHKGGMNVRILNFHHPEKSSCYDPFKYLTTESLQKKFCTDLYQIANPMEAGGIWQNLAVDLMFLVLNSLLTNAPKKFCNLANFCRVVRGLEGEVGETFIERWGTPTAKTLYMNFHQMDSRLKSSALSSAVSTISILEEEAVRTITRGDDINFEELREGDRPTLLVLRTPALISPSAKAIMSLFYSQYFTWLFTQKEEAKYSVSLYLDEFANSIVLPGADKVFSLCRSWGQHLHISLQSLKSLRAIYGDKSDIICSNIHSWVIFGGVSDETTQRFVCENLLGTSTIEEIKEATAMSVMHRRTLLTPQELLQLKGGLYINKRKTQLINPKPLYRLRRRTLRKRYGLVKVDGKLKSIYTASHTGSNAPEIEYLPCILNGEEALELPDYKPAKKRGTIIEDDIYELEDEQDEFDSKLNELLGG